MALQNIAQQIASEEAFFKGAVAAQRDISSEALAQYRKETVAERRQRLSQELYSRLRGRVRHGAFAGLVLDPVPGWGAADLASMLLGCYEIEVLEALHAPEFFDRSHFVDIGAADGYYAVGALYNSRFKTAVCFEATAEGRETIFRNATRNQVADRLRIFGKANNSFTSILSGTDWKNTIVLCDIEGGEFSLLDDACLKAMKGAMIIVETHNWTEDFWPNYKALLERAAKDYSLRFLERSRFPDHPLPELRRIPGDNRMLMLSEGRPNVMRFLQLVSWVLLLVALTQRKYVVDEAKKTSC